MSASHRSRRDFVNGAAALLAAASIPHRVDAADSYVQAVLAKGPVGYWRLDERHGPVAADASRGGHPGTYRGGPELHVPGALRRGADGAVRLSGRNQYVEIANSIAFSVPTSGQGLTVEAWMQPDSLTFEGETSQRFVNWLGKGEAGAFEWGFRFYSSDSPSRPNRISAYLWNATGGEGAGAYFQDVLTAGRWIHVVACYDPGDRSTPGAGVSIYRDGVFRSGPQRSSGARYARYGIVPSSGSPLLRLGTRDLVSFFTGALDDIAIYPRVLTPGEIAENYRAAVA